MAIEKTKILKILSKTEALYVADYNDTYGVSANMIKKLFQFKTLNKNLNLGNIVLEEREEGEYVVVEGIQKLVTLSLILFALCECYKQTNITNEEAISKIYEKYLLGKYGVKLHLNGDNKTIYEKIIYKERLSDEEKENPLFIVLHKFWKEIKFEQISANDLYKLINAIECYPIMITKGEGLNFYYTINKNSSRLDTTKLVRSYLNNIAPSLIYIFDEMIEGFVESDIYEIFQYFLRDFLIIQNNILDLHDTEIFPVFVAYYENCEKVKSAENILKHIQKFSEYYLKMIKVDFEYFDIKKRFGMINEIDGQVTYPYLMEILDDYDNKKINTDALNLILKTVYDYLRSGYSFNIAELRELVDKKLVLRKLKDD